MYSFFKKIKKNKNGLGFNLMKKFLQRSENYEYNKTNSIKSLLLNNFISNFQFNDKSFKTRNILNIYLLNLLGTYRGWRHSRGLPVRGQRTWSNSWSSYRSNLVLRSFKITISKRIYGSNYSNDCIVAYLAEEVNNMWRLQWYYEWLESKRRRLNLQKNIKNNFKIDLISMSKLQIDTISKKNDSPKSKKSKKNVFTLGFDPGFTKNIIKQNNQIKLK